MADPKRLRLILGDQLNIHHSWFQQVDPAVTYVMMEIRQETDYVVHHIQKVAGFFAAMRRFSRTLADQGHRVIYFRLDDGRNTQNLADNLKHLIRKHGFDTFEYLLPDEFRLDVQLRDISDALPVPGEAFDTEHFLTDRDELARFFSGKKRYLMESFYRRMRQKHHILLTAGKPWGGKWNFDAKNRSRYDGRVSLPPPFRLTNDVTRIVETIDKAGVATIGAIEPKRFPWPISRDQALAQLSDFIRHRLPHFGTYQDAMTLKSRDLFHSRLSFALNTKMLHPMEVIQAAVTAYAACNDAMDVAQVEGFVRQILGWREYVRGVYWALMPDYGRMNYLDHTAPLPGYYWTGNTLMACMRAAIGQSLADAYAHHIQRLMVTGNFALLAGVAPDAVEAWYLGVYIDAVDWVERVNTRGMSQFADAGIVATKPYVSSANYIRNMSDYCDDCHYRPDDRFGRRSCPFNSLYWDFLERHRHRLSGNPRMAMIYRTWERMDPGRRERVLARARNIRERLETL